MTEILAFTMPQVIKLTKVSARQLVYWESHDVFRASYVDDRPGRAYRRVYSFTDVVTLRTLGVLRNTHHVKLTRLRKVRDYLSQFAEFPWHQNFWILNGDVQFTDPANKAIVRNVSGQSTFVVELDRIRDQIRNESTEWNRRDPSDVGMVTRHRHVQHNQWVVQGTRITTAAIWSFHEEGYDAEAIQNQYPSLALADVLGAIEHEANLRSSETAA
ncbi:MAG TPA: DUF433 domain-containing protein [Thermomicrobiales bacterium]|nr:DUF433 domain-containing protein [Thermomicrobiales bacterium]